MKLTSTFLFLFLAWHAKSQDTIEIVQKTIKISGLGTELDYYAFAEGDKIVFDFEVEKGKELKELSIAEYPDRIRFAEHSFEKINGKVINVSKTGVFVFTYTNSNISGRTVKINLKRIPSSPGKQNFNTNVRWINRIDTTFISRDRDELISSDTTAVEVINSTTRVHSQTNLENPNRSVVNFILPANTIFWSYWIGVGDEGAAAFAKDAKKVLSSGLSFFGIANPVVGLALGLFSMSSAVSGENVKYYFLSDQTNVSRFNAGQDFQTFKHGDVIVDHGRFDIKTSQPTKYYLALVNDNTMLGINVNVKIAAVVVKNKYRTVTDKVPSYSNLRVPVPED